MGGAVPFPVAKSELPQGHIQVRTAGTVAQEVAAFRLALILNGKLKRVVQVAENTANLDSAKEATLGTGIEWQLEFRFTSGQTSVFAVQESGTVELGSWNQTAARNLATEIQLFVEDETLIPEAYLLVAPRSDAPEPEVLALVGLGILGILLRRRVKGTAVRFSQKTTPSLTCDSFSGACGTYRYRVTAMAAE